jgi:hypothetical protein
MVKNKVAESGIQEIRKNIYLKNKTMEVEFFSS